MRHRAALDRLGLHYVTLVNGSFLTTKGEPGDVDVVLIFDADELNGLTPVARVELGRLLDRGVARSQFLLDLFFFDQRDFHDTRYSVSLQAFSYWTRVFGVDRLGRQKCFLLIVGGGTP